MIKIPSVFLYLHVLNAMILPMAIARKISLNVKAKHLNADKYFWSKMTKEILFLLIFVIISAAKRGKGGLARRMPA
jgi:hypothetical protein